MTATLARAAARNGQHQDLPPLPVFSYQDAAPLLRRPFTAQAVRFKVQATWPKDSPTDALIVVYIDARLASERLNLVCPTLWSEDFEDAGPGLLLCRLTVDGITRRDVGSGYAGKGLYSDAFKRAAVKFGVGVSLYATPKIVLRLTDGHVKLAKGRDGKSLALTPNGETRCRDLYQTWLSTQGEQAFGAALDHGDVEGSVGDLEDVGPPAEHVEFAGGELRDRLHARLLGDGTGTPPMTLRAVRGFLAATGVGDVPATLTIEAAALLIGTLTELQAEKLDRLITERGGS